MVDGVHTTRVDLGTGIESAARNLGRRQQAVSDVTMRSLCHTVMPLWSVLTWKLVISPLFCSISNM